jgi:thioredoxin-dependent peroxiredoxin
MSRSGALYYCQEDTMMANRRSLVIGVLAGAVLVLVVAGAAGALEVGDKAPDFALIGPEGKPIRLSDLTAKGPVVLYTFIAAFTPT